LVGIIYLLVGLVRGGCITIFLSHAVTSGFTTGAAVIIALTQLKYVLGYDMGRLNTVQQALKRIFVDIRS
jgi:MFS superfamily sulfate permease-like transporter